MGTATVTKEEAAALRLKEIEEAAAQAEGAKAVWLKRKEAAKDAKDNYEAACNELLALCKPIDEPLLDQGTEGEGD